MAKKKKSVTATGGGNYTQPKGRKVNVGAFLGTYAEGGCKLGHKSSKKGM